MKCRYKSIGHTFLWVQWKVRYGQASPRDLLRVKGASRRLKLVSPGHRTSELDRPDCLSQAFVNYYTDYTFIKVTQLLTINA